MPDEAMSRPQQCSFCGARPESVERLFVASGAAICDRCIRSLAREEAATLPQTNGDASPLIGRWKKRSNDGVDVSLRFTRDGLLWSTTVEGSTVTARILHYTLKASELSIVELVACGERETDVAQIAGDILTLRTSRGISIFDRETSDI